MRECDVLCVLVSITPETLGLIGARELAFIKPSTYLIDTGRREAVDEAALCQALRERRIAGAALDTFTVEPLPVDSSLRTLDNVILRRTWWVKRATNSPRCSCSTCFVCWTAGCRCIEKPGNRGPVVVGV